MKHLFLLEVASVAAGAAGFNTGLQLQHILITAYIILLPLLHAEQRAARSLLSWSCSSAVKIIDKFTVCSETSVAE